MKRKLAKTIAAGILAGTATILSGCKQEPEQSILNMETVYGPPPDLEQVSPLPIPTATPEEILEEIMEIQDVYGPPPAFTAEENEPTLRPSPDPQE